jgi:hypothetical protein
MSFEFSEGVGKEFCMAHVAFAQLDGAPNEPSSRRPIDEAGTNRIMSQTYNPFP